MAVALFRLKDSHCAGSQPLLMNKASKCRSWPNAIPRKECGMVLINSVLPFDRDTKSAKSFLLMRDCSAICCRAQPLLLAEMP
eukprot:Skav216099  [mRNA]  locus=scaffold2042:249201:249449:+ [translate_table: standard]